MSNRKLPPDYWRDYDDDPLPAKLPRYPRLAATLLVLRLVVNSAVAVIGYLLLLYTLSEIGRWCWGCLRYWLAI